MCTLSLVSTVNGGILWVTDLLLLSLISFIISLHVLVIENLHLSEVLINTVALKSETKFLA